MELSVDRGKGTWAYVDSLHTPKKNVYDPRTVFPYLSFISVLGRHIPSCCARKFAASFNV
jgi:hypothetical protein